MSEMEAGYLLYRTNQYRCQLCDGATESIDRRDADCGGDC